MKLPLLGALLAPFIIVFASAWVFNHVNSWIGILVAVLCIFYGYKPIKNTINRFISKQNKKFKKNST